MAAPVLCLALMASSFSGAEARADVPRVSILLNDSMVCSALVRAAEKTLGIPEHLLRAVSVVESGRYDRSLGRAEPWPWTINAAGKGAIFRTKVEAVT